MENYLKQKQYYIKFNKNTTICINCNEIGHTFKYCKKPITSYGILCYKFDKKELEFLLVQRKDTIGYIDFLRGKYNTLKYMKILLQEMTKEEHYKLINFTFDELWDTLWVSKISRTYKNEYIPSKSKFEKLDLKFLIENTPTKYIDSEYDIPKGRRSNMESIKECAIREFMEETGYKRNEFDLNDTLQPIEEIFLGSNSIWYKHVYFYAKINTERQPVIGDHPLQIREIKKVAWYNFKESVNMFRKYDKTKRTCIYKAKTELNNN